MEILLFMIIVFFKLMNHYSNFHVFCLYAESGYLFVYIFARTFDETAKKHYNTLSMHRYVHDIWEKVND